MNVYECRFFRIEELIPPVDSLPESLRAVYKMCPQSLFRCFDQRLLVTLDRLRLRYGVLTVNNWFWRGNTSQALRFCGLRPMACSQGAKLSEHKFGRAGDAHFRDVTPQEVWEDIKKDPTLLAFEFIERIEAGSGMSWFHFDRGQHPDYGRGIYVVPGPEGDRAGMPKKVRRVI